MTKPDVISHDTSSSTDLICTRICLLEIYLKMTKNNKFLFVFRLKLPVSPLITVARTSLWNPCNVTSKGKLVVQCRPSMMSWKIYTLFCFGLPIYKTLFIANRPRRQRRSKLYILACNFLKFCENVFSSTQFHKIFEND